MRKQREENNYREVTSKNGEYSARIPKELNARISRYCKAKDINKKKYLVELVEEGHAKRERDFYENLSKEELVAILLNDKSDK